MKMVKIAGEIAEVSRYCGKIAKECEKCPQEAENCGIRMVRGDIASTTVAKH